MMDAPIATALHVKLQEFEPEHLSIENESANHAGYFPGKESHFKVVLVSEHFSGKSRVARHQQVYRCAGELLSAHGGGIHALAIHAYTPDQWAALQGKAPASPKCAGQNKS